MLVKGEEGRQAVTIQISYLKNGDVFRCNDKLYMVVQIYLEEHDSYHSCYVDVKTGLSENLERYRSVEHLPWANIDPGDE